MKYWKPTLTSAALGLGLGLFGRAPRVAAVGDAATHYTLYVPANNDATDRRVFVIVTSVSGEKNTVNIVDDDADGDNDDTVKKVSLNQGESYVVRIADGSVNDDKGGKQDGDYFIIDSTHPVVVQTATASNWQHDWVPSVDRRGIGTSFVIYAPPTSGADNDLDVFAYEDDTHVTVSDISTSAKTSTGKTSVDLSSATRVLSSVLDQGEDLIVRENGLGLDVLDPGRTYWVQSDRPVTVQFGHLGQVSGGSQARDGAGFVPSVNGSSAGSLYYFFIPHDPGLTGEKELRVVCFDNDSTVSLAGINADQDDFTPISSSVLQAGQHLDFVGSSNTLFRGLELYRLDVTPSSRHCTVYEANWMETGSYGTSDDASAVSASNGTNIGDEFVAYIGPPGLQNNIVQTPAGEQTNVASPTGGYASHLYIYATEDSTSFTVTDIDTNGSLINATYSLDRDEYYDFVVDKTKYDAMRASGRRPYVRILASKPVAVMSGNFNDNWSAYFYSNQIPEPVTGLTVSDARPACGGTVDVTVTCKNGTGPALSSGKLTVNLPSGLGYVANSASAKPSSSTTSKLVFDLGDLSSSKSHTVTMQLKSDCANVACGALAPEVTAECEGSTAAGTYANLATKQFDLKRPGQTELVALFLKDEPGNTEGPRVNVGFALKGGNSKSSVQLVRTADPDPAATPTTVGTVASGASEATRDFAFQDTYAVQYSQLHYYRVLVNDGTCTTAYGPVAVRTSSGSSSGHSAGLESNGRLASALARRAIAGSQYATWMPRDVERNWLARTSQAELAASWLSGLLPLEGPSESAPVNVSPADLPAVTNATGVFAADYVDVRGQRVASALLVESEGEVYEHSKALCDRAGGAELDGVRSSPLQRGPLMRAALRNERDATGEYALEFKLYEQPDGTFALHTHWLNAGYPAPAEGQRVINVQLWSAGAGDDVSLAQLVLDGLNVRWESAGEPPAAYFSRVSTLGGRLRAKLAGPAREGVSVRATLTTEQNTTETRDLTVSAIGEIDAAEGPFLDASIDVLAQDGSLLDRVWTSDGAWSAFDDSMWGGNTELTDIQIGPCAVRGTDASGSLALAGCASARAEVNDFAGVARHLGGALAPLDLRAYQAIRFELASSSDVQVCLGQDGGGGSACATVAHGASRTVTLPLAAFKDPNGCAAVDPAQVNLISFASRTPGEQTVSVSGLSLLTEAAGETSRALPCEGPASAADDSGFGCSVGSRGRPGSHAALLAAMLLLGLSVRCVGGRRALRTRGAHREPRGRGAQG